MIDVTQIAKVPTTPKEARLMRAASDMFRIRRKMFGEIATAMKQLHAMASEHGMTHLIDAAPAGYARFLMRSGDALRDYDPPTDDESAIKQQLQAELAAIQQLWQALGSQSDPFPSLPDEPVTPELPEEEE